MANVFEWVEEHGICDEKDYPYTAKEGVCKMDSCDRVQGVEVRYFNI